MTDTIQKNTTNTTNKKINYTKTHIYDELILSSGGLKGTYMVGVLSELNYIQSVHSFTYYTGTSIGSILSLLLSIHYTVDEIKNIMMNINFNEFQEIKLQTFISSYGFDNGTKIVNLIKAIIVNKNINPYITFKELYEKTGKILTCVTTNLTTGVPEYHNYITMPDLQVVKSINMSMNIPIIFSPILYNNCYYVDGGLLEDYAYYYNKGTKKIGIYIIADMFMMNGVNKMNNEINGIASYMQNILHVLYVNYNKTKIKSIPPNTIKIYSKNDAEGYYNFNMTQEEKMNMYNTGKQFFIQHYKKILRKRRILYLSTKYFHIWRETIQKRKI